MEMDVIPCVCPDSTRSGWWPDSFLSLQILMVPSAEAEAKRKPSGEKQMDEM